MANNENEFENEPLGDDFDQGVDFGEFDADQKRGSIGDVWKSSPIVKLGLIGAAVLVVVAAVALFGGSKVEGPSSQVGSGAKELKEAPGTSEVTPVMREALEEHNQQRLEAAQKEGGSSIPTPIEPPKVLLGVPEGETNGEDPLVRWKRMQEERVKLQRQQEQYVAQAQEDPQKQDRINSLQQAMMSQFQQALEKHAIAQMQRVTVLDPNIQRQQTGVGEGIVQASGGIAPVAATDAAATATPLKVILPAGEIEYAQLLVEANSDIPGPIVALIVSGPFNGSKVLGSFQKKDEYLTLQFTTLVSKEGYSVPITATAVDPDTTLGGMATEVDHRYWARVILPAAAKFLEGFGKAVGDSGTTTITVDTGGSATATENNDLNTKEELAKAGEEAFSKVSDILDEEGNKTEILVRVKAGTPMGLLFTSGVTQQQIDAAKYGVAPQGGQQGVAPNGQQQVPYPGFPGGNLTPLQMLQQGLGNQQVMQQVAPYYPAYPNATSYGTTATPYPGIAAQPDQVGYTNGSQ